MKVFIIVSMIVILLNTFYLGWSSRFKRIEFLVRVARIEHLATLGMNSLRYKEGKISFEEKRDRDLASYKKFSSRVYKILKITCLYEEQTIKDRPSSPPHDRS